MLFLFIFISELFTLIFFFILGILLLEHFIWILSLVFYQNNI